MVSFLCKRSLAYQVTHSSHETKKACVGGQIMVGLGWKRGWTNKQTKQTPGSLLHLLLTLTQYSSELWRSRRKTHYNSLCKNTENIWFIYCNTAVIIVASYLWDFSYLQLQSFTMWYLVGYVEALLALSFPGLWGRGGGGLLPPFALLSSKKAKSNRISAECL